MAEVYANIVNFPNYQISTFGNCKNVITGRVLKSQDGRNGYLKVNVYCDGERASKKIHKLVASAFLENPENKRCIDHIDRCRTNNHISNLRYATDTENNQNVSIRLDNTSGVSGVCFHKASQKWQAEIKADGRKIYLGSFEDKNDAIVARQNAEITYFGSFRATNN